MGRNQLAGTTSPPRPCTGSTRIAPILPVASSFSARAVKLFMQSGRQAVGSRPGAPKGQCWQSGKGRKVAKSASCAAKGSRKSDAARDGKRAVAETVVAAGEGEDAPPLRRQPRGFQRRFDRFAARVGEDRLARAELPLPEGELRKPAAQCGLLRARMDVAHGVVKSRDLVLHGNHDFLRRKTEARNAEAAGQIEEAVAVDVPHIRALRALPEHRKAGRDVGHIARFMRAQLHRQLARTRAGDGGDEFGPHAPTMRRSWRACRGIAGGGERRCYFFELMAVSNGSE